MEIKARCLISELPTRLRRLAEYRRKYTTHTYDGTHDGKCVDSFQWKETPEGRDFWDDVYFGRVPYDLEAVLDKFEKEHPELCHPIDWEQRRYEIAKACMAGLVPGDPEGLAKASVACADALIAELKKQK